MRSRSGQQQQTQQQHTANTTTSKYRNVNDPHSRGAGFGASIVMNPSHNNNGPSNIMHDRRVIRGSTIGLRRTIENRLNDLNNQQQSKKKSNTIKRRMKSIPKNDSNKKVNKTITPRPVSGRLHAEIQTDPYLEEIHVTKKEQDFATQTDPFLDRPSTPLFVPKLSGKSMATQIEDGDLFDFDREVEPILEVLIGKTIEQSLMEVLEEEELKSYAQYKQQFEQKRNVELAKCQRLEEEQRRSAEEKQRRIEQAEQQQKEQQVLKKRIEAQRIATEFLENIENVVFEELDKRGYFYDPIKKEMEQIFIPKLLEGVQQKVNDTKMSIMIMDDIIHDFVKNMINDSIQVIQQRDDDEKELEKQEIYKKKLEEKFVEKRKEFTQSIKSQKEDYDFKQQIVEFLDIPITAPSTEDDQAKTDGDGDNDEEAKEDQEEEKNDEEEEEEKELPAEIQANIEFIDNLVEQFNNDEEPLWKQIKAMLDKIGGETEEKIERMEQYLQKFSIKAAKKELLDTFVIYKEDEENLKKAIANCLGIEALNEELHTKYVDALKGDEQKDQMECIDELTKEKENIKDFVAEFIKQKADERAAAEEAAKAQEAAEDDQDDQDDEDEA